MLILVTVRSRDALSGGSILRKLIRNKINWNTFDRAIFDGDSKVGLPLVLLSTVLQPSQPIQNETKTNCVFAARIFVCLAPVSCICLEF